MFCCTKLSAGLAAAAKATGAEKMIATSMTKGQIRVAAQGGSTAREYEFMKISPKNSRGKLYPQNGKRVETGFVPAVQYPQKRLEIRQILNLGCSIPDFIVAGLTIKATHRCIIVQ